MVLDGDPLTKYLRDEFGQNLLPGTAEEMHKIEVEQAKAGIKTARAKEKEKSDPNRFVRDASRSNRAGRPQPSHTPEFDNSPFVWE